MSAPNSPAMFELVYSAFKKALSEHSDMTVPDVIENFVPRVFQEQVFERFQEENVSIKPPSAAILTKSKPVWRTGYSTSNGYHWSALQNFLLSHGGRTYEQVGQLDRLSDGVLFSIGDPKSDAVHPESGPSRCDYSGLVIGYVQSGKTANYTALAAKAFDAGYALVIVLTGIHNTLRRQTQIRMNDELGVVQSTPERPTAQIPHSQHSDLIQQLTSEDLFYGDFQYMHLQAGSVLSLGKHLCVTKKNASVLRKLLNWLGGDVRVPVLVIDDEADQASINIAGAASEEESDEEYRPSTINGLIRQLKTACTGHRAYVAYTATPYANVFIDMNSSQEGFGDDLYPEDFIISLPKPQDYMGPLEFFGPQLMGEEEGENLSERVLRIVREDQLKEFDSLHDAPSVNNPGLDNFSEKVVLQFILATAAKRHVFQKKTPSTFLFHTSSSVQNQTNLGQRIKHFINHLHSEWRYNNAPLRAKLEGIWAEFREEMVENIFNVDFYSLESELEELLNRYEAVQVRVLNFKSDDELDYQLNPDLVSIVVGGNKLSRGLTLEGLIFSCFLRKTGREPQADTLTQMGRFFGYRRDVVDITRVFTTDKLRSDFREISQMEEALRSEISLYQRTGKTPRDFAPRVQRRARILPTAPARMKSAEVQGVTYSGDLIQTTSFENGPEAKTVAKSNFDLTSSFLSKVSQAGNHLSRETIGERDSKVLWREVSGADVLTFIEGYRTVEGASRFDSRLIATYVRDLFLHSSPELTSWSVALVGRGEDSALGTETFGLDLRIGRINRSLDQGSDRSIGTLINPLSSSGGELRGDEVIDFTSSQVEMALREKQDRGSSLAQAVRNQRPVSNGLLLIYPVSPRSIPETRSNKEKRLLGEAIFGDSKHDQTIVGLSLVFPHSRLEMDQFWIQRSGKGAY